MGHRVSKQQQQCLLQHSDSIGDNRNNSKGRRKSSTYTIHRRVIDNLIHPSSNNKKSNRKNRHHSNECSDRNEINVLVLGASESGKTTLVNQLRLMSSNIISKEERLEYRTAILFNIIEAMQSILNALVKYDLTIHCPKRRKIAEKLRRLDLSRFLLLEKSTTPLLLLEEVNPFPTTLDIFKAISTLWKEEDNVKMLYDRRYEYQLPTVNNTAGYYFNITLDRLSASKEALINYIPTDQEILRANRKTARITEHTAVSFRQFIDTEDEGHETSINHDHYLYNIIDVGGLRTHRKQWAEAFTSKPFLSTLLFMVSLSEYDQCLLEDPATNRMQESLLLFQSVCDLHYFKKSSIILFFNKTDVFKEKLQSSPLEAYFPHYRGKDSSCSC